MALVADAATNKANDVAAILMVEIDRSLRLKLQTNKKE